MGWRQAARRIEAAQRRDEREAARRRRELAKQAAQEAKLAEAEQNQLEAEQYAAHVAALTSLHRDCSEAVDWPLLAKARPKEGPVFDARDTNRAEAAQAAYRPGFFTRIFGTEQKQRAALEREVLQAQERDQERFEAAKAEYEKYLTDFTARTRMALAILNGELSAYKAALEEYDPFGELTSFSVDVQPHFGSKELAVLQLVIGDPEVVPDEELKLTATGKLSTKALPAGRRNAVVQDFVCSSALRAARETFAVLPVQRVIVNVYEMRLNTATGVDELSCILGLHVLRSSLPRVVFSRADASDCLANFQRNMSFKPTTGLGVVTPFDGSEQWVTTD